MSFYVLDQARPWNSNFALDQDQATFKRALPYMFINLSNQGIKAWNLYINQSYYIQ